MKLRSLAMSFLLVLGLAIGLGVYAQSGPGPGGPGGGGPGMPGGPGGPGSGAPKTDLQKHMDDINDAFKALRNQVGDASKNADSIKQVETMKQNFQAALKLEPAKKADIPAKDQAKFVDDFHKEVQKMLDTLDKLETALKAGKNDDAQKIYAEVGDTEKEGHTEFKKMPARGGPGGPGGPGGARGGPGGPGGPGGGN